MEDGGEGDLSHEKVRVCERVCMRERKRKKERDSSYNKKD